MNINSAKKKLTKLGWSVLNRGENAWAVYDSQSYNGRYTDRELIKLAESHKSSNWKPAASNKATVGPGGINCSCCTKASASEMKRWERRANRRKNKKIEIDTE